MPSSLPRYKFDPDASYLIVGGLGGLGRSVARWMAVRADVRADVAVFDIIGHRTSVVAAGKSEFLVGLGRGKGDRREEGKVGVRSYRNGVGNVRFFFWSLWKKKEKTTPKNNFKIS